MSELLPCPFCGGEAEIMQADNGRWHIDTAYCGIGDTSHHAYVIADTEAEAIAAWNTRAEMDYEDALILLDELNAELGSENCARCAEDMGRYADSLCDPLKERIAELLRCMENDWNIRASWDGLRKFWSIELTEEGVRLRDAELNSRAERTCECIVEYAKSPLDGKTIVLHRCSSCNELMRPHMNYCPSCGARRVDK